MQQINLYLPEFQPSREPLRSVHMLWGIFAFIALLLSITYMSAQTNKELAAQVEQNRIKLEKLKNQVAQLEQQRPNVNIAELDAMQLTLTQSLTRREQIFQIIANKNIGNNTGFSSHLESLGRRSLDTVSLDAFSLLGGGNYVEFAGEARSVDQVLVYIQRLHGEPAFAQSAFGVLDAKVKKSDAGVFKFTLAKQESVASQEKVQTAVQKLQELNEESEQQLRGQN